MFFFAGDIQKNSHPVSAPKTKLYFLLDVNYYFTFL